MCTKIESEKACQKYDDSKQSMEHCIYNCKIYKNVNENVVKFKPWRYVKLLKRMPNALKITEYIR